MGSSTIRGGLGLQLGVLLKAWVVESYIGGGTLHLAKITINLASFSIFRDAAKINQSD